MDLFFGEREDNQVKKLKVLIVENDEISAMLQTEIVKEHCRDVLYAVTGLEAVVACRSKNDIDLILMDINMPVMNGLEATRQIRQFNTDIVIIAQTAYSLTGDREKALEAGCNDYLAKPYTQGMVREIIKKYFNILYSQTTT